MFVSVSMWLKFFGHVKIFDTKYLFVRKVKVMWRGSGKQIQKHIQVQIQIFWESERNAVKLRAEALQQYLH